MEIVAVSSAVKLDLFLLIATAVTLGGIAVGSFFWAVQRLNGDWPSHTRGTAVSIAGIVLVALVIYSLGGVFGMQSPEEREAAIEEARDQFWLGE